MDHTQDDELVVVEELSEADKRLIALFDKLEAGSLDTLEAAARQIITLVTGLQGLIFGVLAFKDSPSYLSLDSVKVLGALALGLLLAALFFALEVVIPRRYRPQDLSDMRRMLQEMLERKRAGLGRAIWAFGCGALFLLAVTLVILFHS